MATPEAAPEATPAPARPDEDCLQAQYDECLSLSLIFPDEFRLLSGLATSTTTADAADLTLLSPDDLAHPISFSVRLQPADAGDNGDDDNNDHDQQQLLWPTDRSFALVVTYPPSYPSVAPMFSFSSSALHPIQEEACLTAILTGIRPDRRTYLTIYPTGEERPLAASLNPAAGAIAGNLVVAKVGSEGRVTIFNERGSLDLTADATAYFV